MTAGAAAVVFGAALATALATGLGALPFAVRCLKAAAWLGTANALASGVMLGATGSLVWEGVASSGARTALGAACGALFVALAHRFVASGHVHALRGLNGFDTRKALLIVIVMTVHSVSEGVGVGAAFGGGDGFGLLIAAAIAIHNVPEGLAISLVLVPRGARVRAAAAWSVFSSLPQPLMAVPAFFFVEQVQALLPVAFGFAAGAMLWMVVRELLPEALAQTPARRVATVAAVSCVLMLGLQIVLL